MLGALALYAGVSIFFYIVNGPPPPEGYTHDDVCVRCGEDYEWKSPFILRLAMIVLILTNHNR